MFSTFSTLVISRFFRKTSSDNKLSNSLLSLTKDYGCAVLHFVCAHYAIVWRHAPFQPVLSAPVGHQSPLCLLYTSDAADDLLCVDLGGRRIIKKKKKK